MGVPRIFTNAEEEDYIQLSHRADIFDLFAQSIAPSIYGNLGINDIADNQISRRLLCVYCLVAAERSWRMELSCVETSTCCFWVIQEQPKVSCLNL